MKRFICVLMAVFLMFGFTVPQNVQAASNVKVKYKGTTKSYTKKKTYVYINGTKKKISQTPVFLKSGSYVGPVYELFINSSLKVKYKKSGNTITLTYNKKTVKLTNGSTTIVTNGIKEKSALLAAPMFSAKYTGSGKSRLIAPIKSICIRLGIGYQLKDGVIYLGKMKASAKSVSTTVQKTATTTQKATATAQKTATTAKKTASTTAQKTVTAAAAGAVGSGAATTAAKTNTTQKKIVLVLDAGHGGVDSGAVGNGYREKDLTLAIVLGAKKYFDNDSRFAVYYTRTSDTYPSLVDRSKLANTKNADLFLSVHINSASASATGTETLYNNSRIAATKKGNITSKELAFAIQKAVVKSTGFANRGLVNRTGLSVLNKTTMPACLVEYGFISNPTEAKKMHANTSRYGKELYQAIVDYLKTEGKIK